jgi:TolB protein
MKIRGVLLVSILLSCLVFFSAGSFFKAPSPEPRSPSFSPDGEYLIFSLTYEKRSNIYRIRKDGNELTRLTISPGRDFDPAYSPDGTKIVFARIASKKDSDPANLYIMNSDGSNASRLTSDSFHERAPIFSPEGQRIYFVRARWLGHNSPFVSSSWKDQDIFSIKVDGSDLKAITNESFYAISRPSISLNGKEILAGLTIYKDPNPLWIVPINNPKIKKPVNPNLDSYLNQAINNSSQGRNELPGPSQPQFSPDGESILFVWATNEKGYYKYEIFVMDFKNKDIRKITNLESYIASPSFSGNGKEIVFLSDFKRNGSYELWLVNSDGTNPHRISIDLKNCLNCASTPASF